MGTYTEEQNAIFAYIQDNAQAYAAEFAKLTGQSWTVSGQTDMDDRVSRSYTLTQADGMAVCIVIITIRR